MDPPAKIYQFYLGTIHLKKLFSYRLLQYIHYLSRQKGSEGVVLCNIQRNSWFVPSDDVVDGLL